MRSSTGKGKKRGLDCCTGKTVLSRFERRIMIRLERKKKERPAGGEPNTGVRWGKVTEVLTRGTATGMAWSNRSG